MGELPKRELLSRRDLLRDLAAAAGGVGLAAVSGGELFGAIDAFAERSGASMSSLIAAAKKEGHINLITIPLKGWANYGQIMNIYSSRYNIHISDAIPDGNSAQELAAVHAHKGQGNEPDVVDVSPAVAVEGQQQGVWAPYKVSTWSSIPKGLKEPKARWWGDYWGTVSWVSLNSVMSSPPKSWADMTKQGAYPNQICLGGDPTQAGEAFGAVFGAALANGGSLDDIGPGIDFFGKVKAAGNWNPTTANTSALLSKGTTPLTIRWDYLTLAMRDELKASGQATTVTIPATGPHYAGYYCQAISKWAPHPNASKLWEEFIMSDEGQILFLKGYTHPARYTDIAKRGKVPKSLAAKLPAAKFYKNVKFASVAQITKAQGVLASRWHQTMG
jgi:putative spermidine/putrescine transport system substrate-binding protein